MEGSECVARVIGIGCQDFETIQKKGYFYIDKTKLIKEWWENGDNVTLIARPRRFGKTLNMSMLEKFFSVKYAERQDLFEGLKIWEDEKYRNLQGTYPVIFLSFADIKETTFQETRKKICKVIQMEYNKVDFLLEGDLLNNNEKDDFNKISADMEDYMASLSLKMLSDYLSRYYGKKVIILLDEYDTPMQEAYVNGYWNELAEFTRSLFNATFKTNPYLERAIMTGITRVSKESIFSDLNNLEVVTTTSGKYEDAFGFTEEEVFAALDEYELGSAKQEVKLWYNGFTFGKKTDIYNPWSVINYLEKKKVGLYWANTSSNSLVGKLIREGDREVKKAFEGLLNGEHLITAIDEQIVYNQLDADEGAIWSLLLASGYLKVIGHERYEDIENDSREANYELDLTNLEVRRMFNRMIKGWFGSVNSYYNEFVKALLLGDIDAMNDYMNDVSQSVFSYFDTGKNPSRKEPERFYHGFVLGLMVELKGRYALTSNRESGFGRYDVLLEPLKQEDDAIILEFKVFQPRKEKNLEDTVAAALNQIEDKNYETVLLAKGITKDRIRKYGFAFCGSQVLIGSKSG
ncbi:MAG: AAA family ATPase [Dorea sp.]|nr:AAA family ATPase [Dorea sp.]